MIITIKVTCQEVYVYVIAVIGQLVQAKYLHKAIQMFSAVVMEDTFDGWELGAVFSTSSSSHIQVVYSIQEAVTSVGIKHRLVSFRFNRHPSKHHSTTKGAFHHHSCPAKVVIEAPLLPC